MTSHEMTHSLLNDRIHYIESSYIVAFELSVCKFLHPLGDTIAGCICQTLHCCDKISDPKNITDFQTQYQVMSTIENIRPD